MVRNFRKYKIAVVTIWLACAVAFLALHLATGASTPYAAHANNLSGGDAVKEIAGYKGWTKVNSVPQLMPERVASACIIMLTPDFKTEIDGPGNPHRDKYFTVYVNEVGRAAMLNQKHPQFPQGAVIVKEKLPAPESQTPELLTVMIKQKKGFNPASGDWEYMVLDGTGTKITGRGNLQHCQECHVANQKTDYIFRTYLPDGAHRGLK